MESGVTKEFSTAIAETAKTDSTDTFQSFIYDLFEKNGILNDLRAYLRGHIVNVLKSAQTGDPPACQRNFTQRLELASQALNILIAEYLLRLEFSYSFSVFISEIPLANMVFEYAKTLMENTEEEYNTNMKFRDSDVWSILSCLGVQCDSEHASGIVEMYRNDKSNPLLLCILKCLPMCKEGISIDQVTSKESLSSARSIDSIDNRSDCKTTSLPENCKHFVFCKSCQNRMSRVQEKYKKKKKTLEKNIKESNNDPFAMESLIKNISIMEKSLIEEMFQQLKSVYETEMEMVKEEEEKRVKRSMATHALQLQKKSDEMEELFKAREADLERNVQQKKQFLWGLARALREQHEHMTRAMHDVQAETLLLSIKEDSLKTQLAEAEQILKKRGEEMRTQINNELSILEGHLESMKKERENITKERSELEHLKIQDNSSKVIRIHNMDSDDVHSHYDLLRSELAILKKYLESSRLAPKCVIERGTVTDGDESSNFNVLNNQAADKSNNVDDVASRLKTNQLINDFKKKNVNFSQSNLDELYRERSHEPLRSSGSSEAGDNADADFMFERNRDRELIQRLTEENERLKAYAIEQRARLEQLSAPPDCMRPGTAPAAAPTQHNLYSVTTSASANTVSVGWRKGAGEELSVFSNAQPRILVPGDTLPFIGVLRDRHGNARRPLTCHARVGRGRVNVLAGVSKKFPSPLRERLCAGSSGLRLSSPRTPCSLQPEDQTYLNIRDKLQQRPRPALSLEINRDLDKNPNSITWEAKCKLRSGSDRGSPPLVRERSPNAVLREAKLRLRKLEIEAEAVEKSYLDFRRKQSALRLERNAKKNLDDALIPTDTCNLEVKQSRSLEIQKLPAENENNAHVDNLEKSMRSDFEKYFREYENKFDVRQTYFRSKPTVADKAKPIPGAYSYIKDENDQNSLRSNHLETPLPEFRKLYTSARQVRRDEDDNKSNLITTNSDETSIASEKRIREYQVQSTTRNDSIRKAKNNKQAELEILKQNISKMYNLQSDRMRSGAYEQRKDQKVEDENILRVEVENVSETNDIKSKKQDLLLVVQSTVNAGEVRLAESKPHGDIVSAQMTIIVSPKRSVPPKTSDDRHCPKLVRPKRSELPEQAAHLTRNDVLDAIFHADPNNNISSVQMQLDISKDSITEYGKGEEYADDFSADVDNYNSRSDYENSPISQPKTSEDDNFWDS